MDKRYPAKILLFGEYSVLNGSKALVVPYDKFSGEFSVMQEKTEEGILSNGIISELINYIEENGLSGLLDIKSLKNAVKRGLYFHSTIPHNYGLGSSGALTAAIFNEFPKVTQKLLPLEEIKKYLSRIESFFHGSSSGIDPLCSLIKKPVIIDRNSLHITNLTLNDKDGITTFIIDTKHHGKTAELVSIFNEMYAKKDYCSAVLKEYVPVVNECIDLFIKDKAKRVLKKLFRLSVLQLKLFRSMIPDSFVSIWEHGIETQLFSLKLCGSGGGGYLLGFTENWEETQKLLKKNNLEFTNLEIRAGYRL